MSDVRGTSCTTIDSQASHAAGQSPLARIANLLAVWQERRRSRSTLAHMSESMLKDIGLSPGDAINEWEKPFWRA
jgi:uncharacterized protein YjiS (DUF1127 family)